MDYLLSKKQYQYLRTANQSANALVPELQQVELSKSELKELEQKGYMKDGRMTEMIASVFKTICIPLTVQRQRLINLDVTIEQVLYYSDDQPIVCVSEGVEEIKVECPYNNEDDLEAMSQYLGGSLLKGMSLELHLPTLEALVLAGIWDCVRRENFENIFKNDLVDSIRKDQLLDFIEAVDSSQSFCFFIKKMNKLELDRLLILEQLKRLEQKGLIEGSERITLKGECFEVIMRFQQIKTMLQLTTALDNGQVYGSEIFILQDGVRELILMEIGAEEVSFLSMSSLEVMNLLNAYYEAPDKFLGDLYDLEVIAETQSQEKMTESKLVRSSKFCTQCGAKRSGESKFCSECGNKF